MTTANKTDASRAEGTVPALVRCSWVRLGSLTQCEKPATHRLHRLKLSLCWSHTLKAIKTYGDGCTDLKLCKPNKS